MLHLLTVCTANQCRSPMAAALAAAQLERRGVLAETASRGMLEGGHSAAEGAVAALRRRGLDLAGHTSRQLDATDLAVADLVITMERRHLVAIAQLDLDAVRRSFTLLELAELAVATGRRRVDEPLGDWVARVDRMRGPGFTLSQSTEDDLPDPMGGRRAAFRRSADRIDDLLGIVFDQCLPTLST